MTDAVRQEILELLEQSTAGLTIRQIRKAVSALNYNQLLGELVELEEDRQITMDLEGRYTRRTRQLKSTSVCGRPGYLNQRTQKGGVMTTEGWIPYYPHPSGWDLPVKVDDQGRPHRKHRRLVYLLPTGEEFQPEELEEIGRTLRAWP